MPHRILISGTVIPLGLVALGATILGPPPGRWSGRLVKPEVCAVTTQYLYQGPSADLAKLERDGRLVRLPAGTRVRWLEMDQPPDW